MIKEIHEQPKAIRDTLNSVIHDGQIDLSAAGLTEDVLAGISEIHIVACGSAWHAGMAGKYVIEDPRIDRMLGYTNLETEKGFIFFQKFLADNKIIDRLKELGCKEGDTVRLYGHRFDYYD
jgi:Obg family GTPase CgtA-like protein